MKKFSQLIRGMFALCLLAGMVFCCVSCGKKDDAKKEDAKEEKSSGKGSASKMTREEIFFDELEKAFESKDSLKMAALYLSVDGQFSEDEARGVMKKMEQIIQKKVSGKGGEEAFSEFLEETERLIMSFDDPELEGMRQKYVEKFKKAKDAVKVEENADPEFDRAMKEYDEALKEALTAAPKMTKKEIIVDAAKNAIQNKDWATVMAMEGIVKKVLSSNDRRALDEEMEALMESFSPAEQKLLQAEMGVAMEDPNFDADCEKARKALLDKLAKASDVFE